jgi:cytochrome c5
MKTRNAVLAALALGILAAPFAANAEDGDWKRGRIYYRMVCTACHIEKAGGAISPSTKSMAEWKAYIVADKHAKGKDSLKYYVSAKYRDSIKATNKAAAKFSDISDADLMNDLKAFVNKGAKDGDAPAKCS